MSETQDLIWQEENGIGIITLNRPQARNALTFDMYARLREICEGIDPDGSVAGHRDHRSRRKGLCRRHRHRGLS
jgi:enoyl-CoA hydratase/carnithine racemase